MIAPVSIDRYILRDDWIVEQCAGKRVLDLGMVAMTCLDARDRVERFGSSLHMKIRKVADHVVGVDYSAREIEQLKSRYPELVLYAGSVEDLPDLLPPDPYDVIVMGNLIEHLSNPGRALDGIRPFLREDGRLIVTCPNSFGLPNYLRFVLGKFTEGDDHVQSYTAFTLQNLLERHQYRITSVYTGLDRSEKSTSPSVRLGQPVLSRFPRFGGTLVVVAEAAT